MEMRKQFPRIKLFSRDADKVSGEKNTVFVSENKIQKRHKIVSRDKNDVFFFKFQTMNMDGDSLDGIIITFINVNGVKFFRDRL